MGSTGSRASSVEQQIYNELGLNIPTFDTNIVQLRRQYEEIRSQITNLQKELESETIEDNDPEVQALGGLLASMFNSYTERGEEIRKEIGQLRREQDVIQGVLNNRRERIDTQDRADYMNEIAVWNQNRPKLVDITTNEYEGFSLDSKTGSIETALAKGDAIIVEMSPKEYIQRISYDIFGSSLARGTRGVNIENIKRYAKEMRRGVKYDLPWLDYKNKGQEGRHRAMAAILNGYKKIPVAVRLR